ncbi:ankyrin repeat domain-containing protein [Soonwooa buanensis]|nr:ankyrin repeat domain-containing protein [Soonwooa buanensis]
MKKINILIIFCCFYALGQAQISSAKNLTMVERGSLINALHKFNNKKVAQSKSLMLSNTATGGDPCYWVNFAIENYYFEQYLGLIQNTSCQNDLAQLNLASEEYNIEVLEFLLKKGTDPNFGFDGLLPLHLAIMPRIEGTPADDKNYVILKAKLKSKKYLVEIINIFLKYKANPLLKDRFGSSALDYARLLEDRDIVNLLKNKG